jgi:recombination protein RecA
VAKSGSWFTYGDERLGQGREAAKEFLRDHTDVREKIEATIRERLGLATQRPNGEAPTPSTDAAVDAEAPKE